MYLKSVFRTVCLVAALTTVTAISPRAVQPHEHEPGEPHEHTPHRKGHKKDWGCWPGWVQVHTECIEHANEGLGQCVKDKKHVGDTCEKENWGSHSCGPGADGNILICDNHNIHGHLVWSIYANCTNPSGGDACSNCECTVHEEEREFEPCQLCPYLMPGDQYPCWANMQQPGCYDKWSELQYGDKDDLPPKETKNCDKDDDECPYQYLERPIYSDECHDIQGSPPGEFGCVDGSLKSGG